MSEPDRRPEPPIRFSLGGFLIYTAVLVALVTAASSPRVRSLGGRGTVDRSERPLGLTAIQSAPGSVSSSSANPVAGNAAWGELTVTEFALDLPEEYATFETSSTNGPVWHFPGLSERQLREQLAASGLDASQMAPLLATAELLPTDSGGGFALRPTDPWLLAIPAQMRAKLYARLATSESNPHHRFPYTTRRAELERWIDAAHLREDQVRLFQSLTYQRGGLVCFSDLEVMLRRLEGPAERLRFMKSVAREPAVMASIRIRPDTDVDRLVGYWGQAGKSLDLRALLESMQQQPGGAQVNLLHFLPPFARERLFTFPTAVIDGSRPLDCHWTTMNFFSDKPDDSFLTTGVSREYVQKHFYPVGSPSQFGDVIFLHDGTGRILHSARFVAGDLVFTKNGGAFTRPWVLMRLGDLRDQYGIDNPAQIAVFRARGGSDRVR